MGTKLNKKVVHLMAYSYAPLQQTWVCSGSGACSYPLLASGARLSPRPQGLAHRWGLAAGSRLRSAARHFSKNTDLDRVGHLSHGSN